MQTPTIKKLMQQGLNQPRTESVMIGKITSRTLISAWEHVSRFSLSSHSQSSSVRWIKGATSHRQLHRRSMERALVRALTYAIRVHITRSDSTLSDHPVEATAGKRPACDGRWCIYIQILGCAAADRSAQPRDASSPLSKRHVEPGDRKRQLQDRDVRGRGCNPYTVVPCSEIYLQPWTNRRSSRVVIGPK